MGKQEPVTLQKTYCRHLLIWAIQLLELFILREKEASCKDCHEEHVNFYCYATGWLYQARQINKLAQCKAASSVPMSGNEQDIHM